MLMNISSTSTSTGRIRTYITIFFYNHSSTMSSQTLDAYDTALMGILQNEGDILKFLDIVIGFLYRRTDYFVLLDDRNPKMGFLPGVSKQILNKVFTKYERLSSAKTSVFDGPAKKGRDPKMDTKPPDAPELAHKPPDVAQVIEVETETHGDQDLISHSDPISNQNGVCDQDPTSNRNPTSNQDPITDTNPVINQNNKQDVLTDEPIVNMDGDSASIAVKEPNLIESKEKSKEQDIEDDDGDGPPVYTADAECYNGAVRDHYSWAQSIADVDVYVKVPNFVTKGRQLRVKLDKCTISVAYNQDGVWCDVLNDTLCWEIRANECMWTLHPGTHVHINLEKVQERWWDALIVGEPKINVRKIDASRPMTDLGDEEQAKLEEMMFNERQKRLGLPQTQDLKMQEMLKKAWDAENSPFAGQPYDPSVLSSSTTFPSDLSSTNK